MSPTEFDLRAHLDREAEHIDTRGSFAAAVVEAKRRSDRRRARAGGIAAAALLAVAVPLAWSSLDGRGARVPATSVPVSGTASPTSATTPTTNTTTALDSATPTVAPTATRLIRDALVTARPTLVATAESKDPGVPYSAAGVFHEGSTTVTGPLKAGYATFARLDHGGYAFGPTSGEGKVHIVSAAGRDTVLEGAQVFVVSADRTRIAWTDGRAINAPGDGLVHIADSSGRELSTIRVDGSPSALVGDTLFVIKQFGYDYGGTSWRIDVRSGQRTEIEGNVLAVHEETGLAIAAGPLPPEPDPMRPADRCYQIVDVLVSVPSTRLSVCGDYMPAAFSPDGRYVVGGGGQDTLVVADVTSGQVVLDALGSSGLHVEGARMADDGSAVVMSVKSADWSRNGLVRCTLRGDCTQVGDSLPEPEPASSAARTSFAVSEN